MSTNVAFNYNLICPTRAKLAHIIYTKLSALMGDHKLHDLANQRRIGALNRWLVSLQSETLPPPPKLDGCYDAADSTMGSASGNDPFITGLAAEPNPLHPLRWRGDVRKVN